MDGLLTCARYSFSPNYYRYCGPDANRTIADYLREGVSDLGLRHYLAAFATLFPYLRLIAHENGIADPFDPRVVQAYWVGNRLLEQVGMKSLAKHLLEEQHLKKRLPPKKLRWVIAKVPKGARLHHSFHVFSIFTRTGHQAVEHTVDTMDQCRIGWGKIVQDLRYKVQDLRIHIRSQKLVYENGKLGLRSGVVRELMLPVDGAFAKSLRPGNWVTYHWGFVCDMIDASQVHALRQYTLHNLRLANETI